MTPVLYPNCVLDPITAADTESASTRWPGKRGKGPWGVTGCVVTLIACKWRTQSSSTYYAAIYLYINRIN